LKYFLFYGIVVDISEYVFWSISVPEAETSASRDHIFCPRGRSLLRTVQLQLVHGNPYGPEPRTSYQAEKDVEQAQTFGAQQIAGKISSKQTATEYPAFPFTVL